MSNTPQFNRNKDVYVAAIAVGDDAVLIAVVEASRWSIRIEKDGHSVELLSRWVGETMLPVESSIAACTLIMERLQAVLAVR